MPKTTVVDMAEARRRLEAKRGPWCGHCGGYRVICSAYGRKCAHA